MTRNAYAVYFTIQLKNGNTIKTEKYWEEGQNILFFTQEGLVGLPNKIIKHIAASDGNLTSGSVYYPPEPTEEEQLIKAASISDESQKADIINDIKDRIDVIEANIENLKKNKQTYLNQRAKYIKDKQKAKKKFERLQGDSYITSEDLKDRIKLEESKIMDAEQKIEEVDGQIKNTQNMLDSQARMIKRLRNELIRLE